VSVVKGRGERSDVWRMAEEAELTFARMRRGLNYSRSYDICFTRPFGALIIHKVHPKGLLDIELPYLSVRRPGLRLKTASRRGLIAIR
jgi:hypothetical protein